MHSLVKSSAHKHEGIAAEKIGYGGGVAGFEEAAFVLEDEPVQLRVGGEDGRLAEDVGGENGAVFPDPIVDEGLGILGLVRGDELQRLAQERQAEGPRREVALAAARGGGGAEDEERDGGEKKEREREEKIEIERLHGYAKRS